MPEEACLAQFCIHPLSTIGVLPSLHVHLLSTRRSGPTTGPRHFALSPLLKYVV
jgi:hypothetical protein